MLVSPAFAQAAVASPGGGGMMAFLPLILIFIVFYVLIIRPQSKKAKDHRAMLSAIRRGDKVVTGGGVMGTVTKVVDERIVMVEIAEGIRVRVRRDLISGIEAKTEPVKEAKGAQEAADQKSGDGDSPTSKLKRLLGGKG